MNPLRLEHEAHMRHYRYLKALQREALADRLLAEQRRHFARSLLAACGALLLRVGEQLQHYAHRPAESPQADLGRLNTGFNE